VDPWTNRITLMPAKPVALLSPRDKLPFEITPFVIPLSRAETRVETDPVRLSAPAQPSR
jgi:hypothetical protein